MESAWFLVSVITGAYLGPFSTAQCHSAAMFLEPVIVCKSAIAMTACAVEGQPNVYQACPVFDPGPKVRRATGSLGGGSPRAEE